MAMTIGQRNVSLVLFQALPPLSVEEYRELEASILRFGVLDPVTVDEGGVVIDGHHRMKIADEHLLECPRTVVYGKSDEQKRSMALEMNVKRRQLTREQRRALLAESLRADPQLSNRAHSRRTGMDDKTVASLRSGLEESAEIPHFSERVDPRTGNASQPASKPLRDEVERPRPRSPRKPLVDVFARYAGEADRLAARVSALACDERFARNREQIAARDLGTLLRVRRAIDQVIARLAPDGATEEREQKQ